MSILHDDDDLNKPNFFCEKQKEKEKVEGIILVVSCQKHIPTRVKEFKLPKNNYV